ncbi:MAG: hypothetical protein IPP13_16915 [Kouleothrix sp.]|jgi:hypothetical protein|nr:hypothetical protein [Kouleothrix sp.]
MNLGELLTLLGLAWSRLLIYPGGLAAGLAAGLLAALLPTTPYAGHAAGPPAWRLAAIVLPWLGLALLPLPFAAPLGRPADILVVLALLESPLLLALRHELCAGDTAVRAAGRRRLAALLNGLPTLILAVLALAQVAGTFDIAPLASAPTADQPISLRVLHWLGALGFTLALAPLLGYGAFTAGYTAERRAPGARLVDRVASWLDDGLRLRAAGLIALAMLPWLAPFGALQAQGPRGPLLIAASLAVPALLALLWAYHRLAIGRSPRRWAWAYLGLDGLLLAGLLWAAYAALLRQLA